MMGWGMKVDRTAVQGQETALKMLSAEGHGSTDGHGSRGCRGEDREGRALP